MEVPFVGFNRARIALDEQARMRADPDGTTVWLSSRAEYQPFINWLTRRLTRNCQTVVRDLATLKTT